MFTGTHTKPFALCSVHSNSDPLVPIYQYDFIFSLLALVDPLTRCFLHLPHDSSFWPAVAQLYYIQISFKKQSYKILI